MRNADLALYDAKNAGKNRYAVFATDDARGRPRPALAHQRPAARDRPRRARRLLPAAGRPRDAADHRPRGAGALAAPAAAAAAARPVHPARRGDRPDRAARPDGAADGAARDRPLAARPRDPPRPAHRRERQRPPAAGPGHRRRRHGRSSGERHRARRRSCSRSPRASCCPGDGTIARAAARAGRARRAPLHRRLRHRLLVAVLPADAAGQRPQAGPGVRRGAARHRERVRPGPHHPRPGRAPSGCRRSSPRASSAPSSGSSLLSLGYSVGQGFHLAVPMPADRIPSSSPGSSGRARRDWHEEIVRSRESGTAVPH